jgi:hypothetical protein
VENVSWQSFVFIAMYNHARAYCIPVVVLVTEQQPMGDAMCNGISILSLVN